MDSFVVGHTARPFPALKDRDKKERARERDREGDRDGDRDRHRDPLSSSQSKDDGREKPWKANGSGDTHLQRRQSSEKSDPAAVRSPYNGPGLKGGSSFASPEDAERGRPATGPARGNVKAPVKDEYEDGRGGPSSSSYPHGRRHTEGDTRPHEYDQKGRAGDAWDDRTESHRVQGGKHEKHEPSDRDHGWDERGGRVNRAAGRRPEDATWLHRHTWQGGKDGRDPKDSHGRTRDFQGQDAEGEEDEEGALHHHYALSASTLSPPRHTAGAVGGIEGRVLEEEQHRKWMFSKEYINAHSPSRADGVDLKTETYYRRLYCGFLQDLGMQLRVPQFAIATAVVFCHRFFMRQSHKKNDRVTVASACMFLAGKVEETFRPLEKVIKTAHKIHHRKSPSDAAKIDEKDVYEKQREVVLVGEGLVLATLGFDLNVTHPYKIVADTIKGYKEQKMDLEGLEGAKPLSLNPDVLAQVAWNFLNDGLRTTLCLQYSPEQIAGGVIHLAAKFLRIKVPCLQNGQELWEKLKVTPRDLDDVAGQLLELYEQSCRALPTGSQAPGARSGSSGSRGTGSAASSGHKSGVPGAGRAKDAVSGDRRVAVQGPGKGKGEGGAKRDGRQRDSERPAAGAGAERGPGVGAGGGRPSVHSPAAGRSPLPRGAGEDRERVKDEREGGGARPMTPGAHPVGGTPGARPSTSGGRPVTPGAPGSRLGPGKSPVGGTPPQGRGEGSGGGLKSVSSSEDLRKRASGRQEGEGKHSKSEPGRGSKDGDPAAARHTPPNAVKGEGRRTGEREPGAEMGASPPSPEALPRLWDVSTEGRGGIREGRESQREPRVPEGGHLVDSHREPGGGMGRGREREQERERERGRRSTSHEGTDSERETLRERSRERSRSRERRDGATVRGHGARLAETRGGGDGRSGSREGAQGRDEALEWKRSSGDEDSGWPRSSGSLGESAEKGVERDGDGERGRERERERVREWERGEGDRERERSKGREQDRETERGPQSGKDLGNEREKGRDRDRAGLDHERDRPGDIDRARETEGAGSKHGSAGSSLGSQPGRGKSSSPLVRPREDSSRGAGKELPETGAVSTKGSGRDSADTAPASVLGKSKERRSRDGQEGEEDEEEGRFRGRPRVDREGSSPSKKHGTSPKRSPRLEPGERGDRKAHKGSASPQQDVPMVSSQSEEGELEPGEV